RKTVIRRLAKYLPLSVEFQTAVALDGMAAADKDQQLDTIDGEFTIVGEHAEIEHDAPPPDVDAEQGAGLEQAAQGDADTAPRITFAQLMERFQAAKSLDDLDALGDLIQTLPADQQPDASNEFGRLRKALKDKQ